MSHFNPILRNYHIFFSSTIDRQNLKELAEADSNEVVHTVEEIFADYQPYGAHLFNIPVPRFNSSQIGEIDLRRITGKNLSKDFNGDGLIFRWFDGSSAVRATLPNSDQVFKIVKQLPPRL